MTQSKTQRLKPVFKPVATYRKTKAVLVELDLEDHAHVKELAKERSMSIQDFVTQAVLFALSNMEAK